ncbi:MAG: sensor histidine kinase [Pyrinomonadaceae bacterium]
MSSRKVSGDAGGSNLRPSEIGETAAQHGRQLLNDGFSIDHVVHNYGDLCQAITGLAVEADFPIDVDEFRTLNRCLDNGIAEAVTEFTFQRNAEETIERTAASNERLGEFAHELRNLLNTTMLAFGAIKAGNVGAMGATGAVVDRSLLGLKNLIDRSLSEVRVDVGLPLDHKLFSLADLISEVKLSASLEAKLRESTIEVSDVDPELAIDVDRDLLLSAIGNLIQNAFKFTKKHTAIGLSSRASGHRIFIEVSDKCGGLGDGGIEKMFKPFTRLGKDKSGLGLGIGIAKRSVEANNGTLRVRDVPGVGCVFTIDLPRFSIPAS